MKRLNVRGMLRNRAARVLCAGALLLPLNACLRYVPSRSEVAGTDQSAKYAGEEAFFSLERTQEQRLKQLIDERRREPQNSEASYRVGPGDVLEFTVFEVPELNVRTRVRPSGDVALQLIGQVRAAGRTEAEIQQEVTARLKQFVRFPQVQVFIAEYEAHKVWVIGEIHKPGAYPLIRDNYSLIELLAEAGGRTERASSLVVLIPESAPTVAATPPALPEAGARGRFAAGSAHNGIEIYFDEIVGSVHKPPLAIPLRAGDTIVVPEAGMVQVDGEVLKPGSYQLASRMTLLGAIASASGLSYSANVAEVEILRELGAGQKALLTVNLEQLALREGADVRLRDGDVVRVPSSPGRFATRQTINIFNAFLGRIPNPF